MSIYMRIVHISASAPYNDYWGYQENLLPKYQQKLGHDVYVITTNTIHEDGRIVKVPCDEYVLNDGVTVIRMQQKQYPFRVITGLKARLDVFDKLNELRPDFIFFHGLASATIEDAIKYKRKINPNCKIVQDNHLDYNIGLKCATVKEKIIRAYHRYENKKSIPYIDKVYGVTPWRKTYAEDYFGIPKDKTDVLIMGADDEKIDFANKNAIRSEIRSCYHLGESDFVIVTGGKIDKKKKITLLMEAVGQMPKVQLLIFGNVLSDIKDEFETLLKENDNIHYVGWIDSDKAYSYFFAADLVIFPGQHSVLWEQACASKVPCLFEKWDGMDHVNNGGNACLISDISVDSLKTSIQELEFTDRYYQMKLAAESKNTDIYLYSEIAKKSLKMI